MKNDREMRLRIGSICKCTLEFRDDNCVVVDSGGNAYGEFVAKNIVTAFGRGFGADAALMLVNNDYYFSYIDLRQALGEAKRIQRIKSRIIGEDGRTKRYIEGVSGAKMSVYGHTVGFIGTIEGIQEAETAVGALIDGSTHKVAYSRMEARHRRSRPESIETL